MRELKLESLQVDSFVTATAPQSRGTINAHGGPRPTTLQTYDVQACGETQYFDCTLGCSQNTYCAGACGPTVYRCVLLTDVDCPQ